MNESIEQILWLLEKLERLIENDKTFIFRGIKGDIYSAYCDAVDSEIELTEKIKQVIKYKINSGT